CLLTGKPLAILGNLARPRLVLDDGETVAGLRRPLEAENLDGHRRAGVLDLVAVVVDERTHAAPLVAGDEDVARLERAGLNEDGRNRATPLVQLRLDDDTL